MYIEGELKPRASESAESVQIRHISLFAWFEPDYIYIPFDMRDPESSSTAKSIYMQDWDLSRSETWGHWLFFTFPQHSIAFQAHARRCFFPQHHTHVLSMQSMRQ